MGRLDRATEKLRQSLGWPSLLVGIAPSPSSGGAPAPIPGFNPTPNARNKAMLKECKRFAIRVRALRSDLTAWAKQVAVGLATIQSLLSAPLPRAYDDPTPTLGLGARPSDPSPSPLPVGRNVMPEKLPAAAQAMAKQLQDSVFAPLDQWLDTYHAIKQRNQRSEELRLDLDASKRTSARLQTRAQRLRERQDPDAESALFHMQTAMDKLARMQQRYNSVEAEVFNALVTLIKDAHVLQDLAVGALCISQTVFSSCLAAFDMSGEPRMQQLPPLASPLELTPPGLKPWTPDPATSLAHRTICTPTLLESTRQWRAACAKQRQRSLTPTANVTVYADDSPGVLGGIDSPQPGGSTPRALRDHHTGSLGREVAGERSPVHSFTGATPTATMHDSAPRSSAAASAAWIRASHPSAGGDVALSSRRHSGGTSLKSGTGGTPTAAASAGGGPGAGAGATFQYSRHTRHLSRGQDDLPLPLGLPSPNPWLPLPTSLPLPRIREPSDTSNNPFAPVPGEEEQQVGPQGWKATGVGRTVGGAVTHPSLQGPARGASSFTSAGVARGGPGSQPWQAAGPPDARPSQGPSSSPLAQHAQAYQEVLVEAGRSVTDSGPGLKFRHSDTGLVSPRTSGGGGEGGGPGGEGGWRGQDAGGKVWTHVSVELSSVGMGALGQGRTTAGSVGSAAGTASRFKRGSSGGVPLSSADMPPKPTFNSGSNAKARSGGFANGAATVVPWPPSPLHHGAGVNPGARADGSSHHPAPLPPSDSFMLPVPPVAASGNPWGQPRGTSSSEEEDEDLLMNPFVGPSPSAHNANGKAAAALVGPGGSVKGQGRGGGSGRGLVGGVIGAADAGRPAYDAFSRSQGGDGEGEEEFEGEEGEEEEDDNPFKRMVPMTTVLSSRTRRTNPFADGYVPEN